MSIERMNAEKESRREYAELMKQVMAETKAYKEAHRK